MKAEEHKQSQIKPIDVFVPSTNSLIQEILQEIQPQERLEKNLFQQYIKNLEPPFPGMAKKPLPPFLSKLLVNEEAAKVSEKNVK
jgi:hypothetical protein